MLFVAFVVALDRHWLLAGLGVVFGAFLLFRPRMLLGMDWTLLAIIALMFIDLRQLAELATVAALAGALAHRRRLARLSGGDRRLAIHQQRARHHRPGPPVVHDLPALAAGVNVGASASCLARPPT